jgi:hypothetical protein
LEKINHFDEIYCANEDCLKAFIPKTYNGIFCSPECRRISTNKKLLDKYYKLKENKTKKRQCSTDSCTTILSRYNKEDICEACKVERYIKRLTSWGWSEEKLRDEFR